MTESNKKTNALQQAFGKQVEWGDYPADTLPSINVDMSICSDEERPRMVAIINRLAKSEMGREVLETAKEAGSKFGFLDTAVMCYGCCWGSEFVTLNPAANDDKLVGTLCHESRHAGQNFKDKNGEMARDELDVASILISAQAKEADAQTCAIVACEQLNRQGDEGPMLSFRKYYPPIALAFDNAMAANDNRLEKPAMTAIFKGWYDQERTKVSYEENYIVKPMNEGLKNLQNNEKAPYSFAKTITPERTLDFVATTKDGSYFIDDPIVLYTPRFLSLTERNKQDMEIYFEQREALTGEGRDHSIDRLPTRPDTTPRRLPEMLSKAEDSTDEKTAAMNAQNEAIARSQSKWEENQRLADYKKNKIGQLVTALANRGR